MKETKPTPTDSVALRKLEILGKCADYAQAQLETACGYFERQDRLEAYKATLVAIDNVGTE